MSPSSCESLRAFHELLDLLREMGDRYAGPEWLVQSDDGVGEALPAILHLLEASLLSRILCQVPSVAVGGNPPRSRRARL
jgi:hypothetical protein